MHSFISFVLVACAIPVGMRAQAEISSGMPAAAAANPSSSDALLIPMLKHPVDFDGWIGEGEWEDVDTLSFESHWPAYSTTPNTRTQYRLAIDEKYLYFAALCFDDPAGVQGSSFERDNWNMTMDQVALILDTYNDNENGLIFVVSPTGSRIDVSVRNDAQGEEPIDISWNSFWEARTSRHDQGWSVEARIPFSSLRFQPLDGQVSMGVIAYRYLARERQLDIFPGIPPQWGFWSILKISKARDVQFSKQGNKRPWFTSPYVLGGAGYHHFTPEGATTPDRVNDNRLTGGLDVQHALTDNLNLDLTFNTDFAQVEADDQVVNLTRFSLFFPEKRRFFLERSSIMDFGFENNNRLFYSRRIGINDGRIIPLWGGARVVGRVGRYDVGFMNMESRASDGLDSENFGVFRLRRKVSQNNSYIGAMLTTQTDWKGHLQLAYGADGIFNLFGNDYLKVNLASTYDALDTTDPSGFLNGRNRIYVMWENRAQVGLNYSISYSQVDKYYSPSMGFEERGDIRAIGDRISYGWFPDNKKSLRYIGLNLFATAYLSGSSGRLESLVTAPTLYLEWKKNSSLELVLSRYYDRVPEAFDLSDEVTIEPDAYVNTDLTVNFETPPVHFLNASFNATAGTFYGGRRISAGVTPNFVISKYLSLSGFYQFNRVSFSDAPAYSAHVGRLKVSASLNVKLSVNAFVQLNSLSKITAVNFRLRYNPKDGNDLYLVYNETLNHEGRIDPLLPYSDARALIVKYVHTFLLGN